MNVMRVIKAIPAMASLWISDMRQCCVRLYLRASWKMRGLSIAPTARLHYDSQSQIEIRGTCSLGNFSVILASNPNNSVPLPLLSIGNNVFLSEHVNLRAAGGRITIGNNVLIANNVTIVASNHGTKPGHQMYFQEWERGDVEIEDDVWIGAGAVILPKTIIRSGSVIAAGAVARGEIPSNAIYGGVPAKLIKMRQ